MVKIKAPGYARNVYGQETQSYRAPQRNRLLDHSCDGSNRLVKNIGSTQPEISASGPQMAMAIWESGEQTTALLYPLRWLRQKGLELGGQGLAGFRTFTYVALKSSFQPVLHRRNGYVVLLKISSEHPLGQHGI